MVDLSAVATVQVLEKFWSAALCSCAASVSEHSLRLHACVRAFANAYVHMCVRLLVRAERQWRQFKDRVVTGVVGDMRNVRVAQKRRSGFVSA